MDGNMLALCDSLAYFVLSYRFYLGYFAPKNYRTDLAYNYLKTSALLVQLK